MVPAWRIDGAIDFPSALARGTAMRLDPVEVTHDDIAFLQYTGGTTGVAKGAVLTHHNVLANLEQTGVWVSGTFKEGAEIVVAPLPLYHIFRLTSTLSFMKWGSLIVLITNPRDIPAFFVKELGKWKRACHYRGQYAVQRPPECTGIRPAEIRRGEGGRRRWRRGAEHRCPSGGPK